THQLSASMGQGHSQLKEELARVTKQLNEAQDQSTALKSANEELKRQVAAGTEATMRAQDQRAATERNCVAEIEAMEGRVHQAVKQREVAEELRRSDALLAKRIMTAQMRRSGEKQVFAHGGFEGSTMAAQLALAAQDELQLRQASKPQQFSIMWDLPACIRSCPPLRRCFSILQSSSSRPSRSHRHFWRRIKQVEGGSYPR
ncbi:MAG: hypothetical protein SGPRY_011354, partial [Prymnesium sp.]